MLLGNVDFSKLSITLKEARKRCFVHRKDRPMFFDRFDLPIIIILLIEVPVMIVACVWKG